MNQNPENPTVPSVQHFVYLLECADGTLYTGYTVDVPRRVQTHNKGKGARYTRCRLPVTLRRAWEYETKRAALQAEYRIKQLPRHAKLALVQHEKTATP